MAEYTRGQERGGKTDSGHMHEEKANRRRMPGVDFDTMNYEQRRAPYNNGNARSVSDNGDSEDQSNNGKRRDEA